MRVKRVVLTVYEARSTSAVGTRGQVLRAVEMVRQKSAFPVTAPAPRSKRTSAGSKRGAVCARAMADSSFCLPWCPVLKGESLLLRNPNSLKLTECWINAVR